jgi:hypothetical protein
MRFSDKARIGLSGGPFRLGDHAALAAPAMGRRPLEFLEPARCVTSLSPEEGAPQRLSSSACNFGDQPLVLGQAKQKIDANGLAPTHQNLAGKPRIGPRQNAHRRPAGADLSNG